MARRPHMPGHAGLSEFGLASLRREVKRRQAAKRRLFRERAGILRQLAAIDSKLRAAGIDPKRQTGRRNFRNAMTLVDAMALALNGRTMRPGDIAEAVQKAGYRTLSKSLRNGVVVALVTSDRFKRVARGQYTLKG